MRYLRKPYLTDLSDAEWSSLEPYLPAPKANGRPRTYPLREILDAIFYVVRSGCAWRLLPHDFPTAGRPSTTTSASGVWMEHGKGCTPPCASECGFASRETLSPAQPSSTVSRSKRPGWAESKEDTMEARRSKAENATCWSTRRVWCSKRGSTAQRYKTGRASSSCWRSTRGIVSRSGSLTCGWTLATLEKTRAQTGCRRHWAGRPRSYDIHRSWFRMR